MSDLNWKNESDYAYTAKLNDAGWAWEFIRRSESYRAAYQILKPEDFNRTVPQGLPGHFLTPAERKEAMEAEFPMPPRTPAQKKAALWGLFDMYDPDIVYDPNQIRLDRLNGGLPMMYGPLGGNVRPIKEVYCTDDLPIGPTTLAVFLNLNLDFSGQLKRVKDVFKEYTKTSAAKKRRRKKEWPRYLRMLDARKDAALSGPEKISLIDPKKVWKPKGAEKGKTYGVKQADSTELSKYADETLKAAEDMANEGFRFLLKAV